MRIRTSALVLPCAILAGVLTACSREEAQPIVLRGVDVVVSNLTTEDWTNVEVWVNDHYRGVAPSVTAGQRLVVPLDRLVEAYGRHFDVHKTPVFGVLVTARARDGEPVRIKWGKVRRQ